MVSVNRGSQSKRPKGWCAGDALSGSLFIRLIAPYIRFIERGTIGAISELHCCIGNRWELLLPDHKRHWGGLLQSHAGVAVEAASGIQIGALWRCRRDA